MKIADKILAFLKETYQPDAIIVYGSYADGSANKNSDFDALVIADKERTHDSSVIDGIVLDVFIYPPETFQSEFDPEEFIQVWDGKIILDANGIAARLQKRVIDFIAHIPQKTLKRFSRKSVGAKKCCPEQCARMPKGTIVGIGCCLTAWKYTLM